MRRIIPFLLLYSALVFAQGGQVVVGNFGVLYVSTAPSGVCSANAPIQVTVPAGGLYSCQNGIWATSGGGSMVYPAGTGIAVVTGGVAWGTTLAAPTGAIVGLGQTNVYGAFLQDFSASMMEIPEGSGFVSTVDSTIGMDSSTLIVHLWGPGSADAFNVVTAGTDTTATHALFATTTAGLYGARAITPTDAGLGNVTNNAQTQAAIVPNTAPTAAQVLLGNAGNTAYAPVTLSQDLTVTSAGVVTVSKTNNVAFAASATTNTTSATNITSGTLPLAQMFPGLPNGTDSSGSANVYTVTLSPAPTALVANQTYGCFVPHAVNTNSTPTVNFNGLGAKTIVKVGGAVLNTVFADMPTSEPSCMIYDGTNFLLLNPQGKVGSGVYVLQSGPAFLVSITTPTFLTTTNCAGVGTGANPSVASCTAAPAGTVSCATNASGGTCTVNTTAVTANSQIFLSQRTDTTTGTRLSVTCNTTVDTVQRVVTAVVAATSFTFNLGTITTNPECFSYNIVN